jgi:HEAT repeat protein
MEHNTYIDPVAKLLTLGDCRKLPAWPEKLDYLPLGFTSEHIPDLIRMAMDEDLRWADSESLAVWAPIHAWRALGQLRAEAAIEPLLDLLVLTDDDEDDWTLEELPDVFGLIGPAALGPVAGYLADADHGLWARVTASCAIAKIGVQHPQTRDACVAALTAVLERFIEHDESLNANLIYNLTELRAIETALLMERAFAAGRVDEMLTGGWQEVQVELGLLPAPPPSSSGSLWRLAPPETSAGPRLPPDIERSLARQLHKSGSETRAKAKAKRKQANKSRKRNRKK